MFGTDGGIVSTIKTALLELTFPNVSFSHICTVLVPCCQVIPVIFCVVAPLFHVNEYVYIHVYVYKYVILCVHEWYT